ncbi:electron transport complex subunit G [Marinobacterium zhoushanense]|uniref:Ion-translocating oxidoreductase complex subunit G n=1 Tax=Marinobacterium zhoushanense TaxID=1679163 RepID=A0ABQ1KJB1_9GAMM|nr:electron transport complex subunit RsxG [Marinobacterium zhoushanense]GGC00898.1 electron transport complex subunit G [Marinobacterium zhoushanense]
MAEMLSAVRRSTLGIGIFAIVTAGVIAATQVATKERIEANIAEAEAKALYEILPRSLDDRLHEHRLDIEPTPELGLEQTHHAWQAIVDNEVHGIILQVTAPDGYSGDIHLLVGINRDESLAGIRVTSHKETPGLGDKIEPSKSNWLDGFIGQTMDGANDSSWAVKKDGGRFDQFTGATITPRAVVNAAGRAIHYFRAHKAQLLTPVAKQGDE